MNARAHTQASLLKMTEVCVGIVLYNVFSMRTCMFICTMCSLMLMCITCSFIFLCIMCSLHHRVCFFMVTVFYSPQTGLMGLTITWQVSSSDSNLDASNYRRWHRGNRKTIGTLAFELHDMPIQHVSHVKTLKMAVSQRILSFLSFPFEYLTSRSSSLIIHLPRSLLFLLRFLLLQLHLFLLLTRSRPTPTSFIALL